MAYVLLGVLPEEIVKLINHINNSEHAFIYFTKCTFKKFFPGPEVYHLNELYQKHIKIKNIYNYLTSILECNYLYSREKLQPLLFDISKYLMFCHNINILDKEKSLKEDNIISFIKSSLFNSYQKDNTNYILTKSSIKLWFKLCQKYNLYIFLRFMKDGKRYTKIFNPNKIGGIETFSHFAISPIVLLNEVYPDKNCWRNSVSNLKMYNDYVSKKLNAFLQYF